VCDSELIQVQAHSPFILLVVHILSQSMWSKGISSR